MKRLLLGCSLLFLTLAGCAQNQYAASKASYSQEPSGYIEAPTVFAESSPRYEEVQAVSMGGIGYGGAPRAKLARSASDIGDAQIEGYLDQEADVDPTPDEPQAPAKATRMVSHSAILHLRSSDPDLATEKALRLTDSLGGYIESRNGTALVIRLPAASFKAHLELFADLGTITYRRIWSEDITQSFQDTELRLQIDKDKLQRLLAILEKTTNSEEKVNLLAEIQRLSDQIKMNELMRKQLLARVQYSTLTMHIAAFPMNLHSEEIAVFQWIMGLDPVRTRSPLDAEAFELQAPEGYLILPEDARENMWAAAAADGSEIWARTFKNDPQGDAAFWIEAIRLRQMGGYAKAEVSQKGDWQILQLTSRGNKPFVWAIAVSTKEKELHVVEFLWPNLTAFQSLSEKAMSILIGNK